MNTIKRITTATPGVAALLGLLLPLSGHANIAVNAEDGIRIRIDRAYQPESLTILIDNRDVTALVTTRDGELLLPVMPSLPPGKHSILLSFDSVEGYHLQRRFEIDADTQQALYQGSNSFGITVRGKLYDRNDLNQQDYEADAHVGHAGVWNSGSWSGEAQADLWLLERGTNIDPLEDGVPEVIDYYASARYQQADTGFLAEAGYIQVQQSQNTVDQLARRGFQASLDQPGWSLGLFTANTQQYLGSEGSAGFGDGSDDTVAGFSVGWKPMGDTLKLRMIYSKGNDEGNSFGLLNEQNPNQGEVSALVISSVQDGWDIELELDQSSFDADTTDTSDAVDDDAWGLRIKARTDAVDYRFATEHIGTNYAVVANPLLQNDREYLSFGASMDRGEHGFGLSTRVERDNLDDESTRATLDKSFLDLIYSFRKGRDFNVSLNLQQQQLGSSDEPTTTDRRDSTANSLLSKFNFMHGDWSHLFSLLYSDLNDHLDNANDSEIQSLTYSPALYRRDFNLIPSFTIVSTDSNSGQKIDRNIITLYLRGRSHDQLLSYQLSASLSDESDNVNGDSDSTFVTARSERKLGTFAFMSTRMQHAVGVELEWLESNANSTNEQDDALLWLTYSIRSNDSLGGR